MQVDLIDFSSCPDGDYKYLLNYQDHGTKLYDNAPLTHKTVGAVAVALLSIFSTIGPPQILQADNGREFSSVAGKGKKGKEIRSVDISGMVSPISTRTLTHFPYPHPHPHYSLTSSNPYHS